LKMAVSRFQIASNKKSALLKQNMRAAAVLLAEDPPREEKARIKAEALIRDDNLIEAYDILSMQCELLSERIKLIEFDKQCPPDLVSTVATLIYAAPRVDIPELVTIRKQFRAKYGKKFEEAALTNEHGILNERVVTKLSVQPPAAYLVQTYLERICEQFEVDWSPVVKLTAEQMGEPMAPPVGYSVQMAQGTGLGPVGPTVVRTGQEMGKAEWVDPPKAPSATAYFEPPKAPSVYTPTSTIATNQDEDDFAEPDIFIPAAPGQKSSSSANSTAPKPAPVIPPSAPLSAPPDKKDDDDGDDGDSPGDHVSGSSKQSASYRDLAARFDTLKNL
jgi:vacuolar protein sorting-associated protein IST1